MTACLTPRHRRCQTPGMTSDAHPAWWRGDDSGHRLAGKRAFITGAGTAPDGGLVGVGEAIAVLFAVQGARVAIADIDRDPRRRRSRW